MRVRIVFLLKNRGSHVPFHHQFLLAQMIKGILVKGGNAEWINYSLYNFSGLKGQTKVSRKGLHFYSSRITLVISSPSKNFIDYLLHNLFSFEQMDLGNLVIQPEGVELEGEVEFSESMKFICISPLVILNSSFNDSAAKRFIPPETDSFSDLLYESTIKRMEETRLYTEAI